jgi:hypothetical protein
MALAALLGPGLLSLGLGAGPALSWDTSLRSETRRQVYVNRAADGTDVTADAVELQPRLGLGATWRTGTLRVAYFPLYTVRSGASGRDDDWLHLGSVQATWRPSASWTLRGTGDVVRGRADLLSVTSAATGEAPSGALPTIVTTRINYQNLAANVTATGRLSPVANLRTSLGLVDEGGLGALGRAALPLLRAARLAAAVDRTVWKGHGLGLAAASGASHYLPDPFTGRDQTVWTGRISATYRLPLGPQTRLSTGLGLGMGGSNAPGQRDFQAYPAADLGVEHAPVLRTGALRGGLALAVAPVENRFAASVGERADLTSWLTWMPTDRWSLRGSATGGRVVAGASSGDTTLSGNVRAGWAATTFLDLSVGLRGTRQRQQQVALPPAEWGAYLALSIATQGRF